MANHILQVSICKCVVTVYSQIAESVIIVLVLVIIVLVLVIIVLVLECGGLMYSYIYS